MGRVIIQKAICAKEKGGVFWVWFFFCFVPCIICVHLLVILLLEAFWPGPSYWVGWMGLYVTLYHQLNRDPIHTNPYFQIINKVPDFPKITGLCALGPQALQCDAMLTSLGWWVLGLSPAVLRGSCLVLTVTQERSGQDEKPWEKVLLGVKALSCSICLLPFGWMTRSESS